MSSQSASSAIITPTLVSAAACTGSGREVLKTTIGSPKANRLVACPRPQASPRRAAVRAARSRPVATNVVTAARWSGSVAWRRPSTTATTTTSARVAPSEKCAIQVSSPNMSAHFREGAHGHGKTSGQDDKGARGRQEPDERAVEARPLEDLLGEDGDQADPGDAQGQAGAEGHDQQHPEGHAVQRDRREQDDERGRAGQQSAGHSDRDERPHAWSIVLVVVMAVVIRVAP